MSRLYESTSASASPKELVSIFVLPVKTLDGTSSLDLEPPDKDNFTVVDSFLAGRAPNETKGGLIAEAPALRPVAGLRGANAMASAEVIVTKIVRRTAIDRCIFLLIRCKMKFAMRVSDEMKMLFRLGRRFVKEF